MNRFGYLVAAALLGGLGAGCGEAGVSANSPLDGTLRLVRYDGKALPVGLMIVPPAPHIGTYDPNCWFQVQDGTLEVHVQTGQYALRVNTYNSCTNARLLGLTPDLAGTVTQQGATLKLDVDGRGVFFLDATIESGRVVVLWGDARMEFRSVTS